MTGNYRSNACCRGATVRAFLLIAVGALSACSLTSSNPLVRGGKALLSATGYTPGGTTFTVEKPPPQQAASISEEQEYYIGRAVAARVLTLYPNIPLIPANFENPVPARAPAKVIPAPERSLKEGATARVRNYRALVTYLSTVANVAAFSSARPYLFSGYRVVLLTSDTINAFAAPGGFIFITTGLLNILPNEDALAAVLAHEVAHIVKRHALQQVSGKRFDALLARLGELYGALSCNEALAEASALMDQVVGEIVTTLLDKGYSREQEYEADHEAALILARAGYDPQVFELVFDRLDQAFVGNKSGWFATHPSNLDRRAALASLFVGSPGLSATPQAERGVARRALRFEGEIRQTSGR